MALRIPGLFLMLLLVAHVSWSFETNSSNYKNFPLIVSSGGEISNSSSYKSYIVADIVAGITSSSTYKNLLGFFHAWLLADNQPCTANSQCEGGFCCSNLCSGSSCPVEEEAGESSGASAAAGGGGGGGGGYASNITRGEADYSVSPLTARKKIALGKEVEEMLTIRNLGRVRLIVSLAVEGVDNYLSVSDQLLSLGPDETSQVTLSFIGKKVGSFPGQIITLAEGIEKIIPIILEVISEKKIFDVKLDIPTSFAVVSPGEALRGQITLINVGAPEEVEVFVSYFIKDLKGNVVYDEEETFSVGKQKSFPKSFNIPDNLELGNYVAIVEVRYADSFAVSSQFFKIEEALKAENMIETNATKMLVLAFILSVFLFIVVYWILPVRKKLK